MIRVAGWAFVAGLVLGFLGATCSGGSGDAGIAALERWERVSHRPEVLARHTRDSARAGAVVLRARYRGFRTDTLYLPGKPDSVWIPTAVIATADSTIAADSVAQAASDTLVDRLQAHADSADRLASLWRTKARGPFLQKSVELFFEDGIVWGAAELEAGRGRVSVVARVEMDSTARAMWGVRVKF